DLILISTRPSWRPRLIRRLTVAWEMPSWSAICACVRPSRKCRTSAWCIWRAMTISSRGAVVLGFNLAIGMSGSLPLVQEMVNGDGSEQNATLDHVLPVDRDVEQDQRRGDEREQRDAEDGAEDRPRAAVERSPADHRRGDDVELHPDAEGGRRRAEAGHVDDACNTGEGRAQ